MRKISMLALMLMLVAVTSTAFAVLFEDDCKLSTEPSGKIKVHCPKPGDLQKYVFNYQFCPDQVKYTTGCGNNLPSDFKIISETDAEAQMEMGAVSRGQRALNPKTNVTTWSHVMASKAGPGLVVEMSDPNDDSQNKAGGCHYTFIADLPAGSYVPYKPELCGGNASGKYVAPVKAAPVAAVQRSETESATANVINSPSGMANAANNAAAANNVKAGVVENHFKNVKGNITVKTKIKQQTNTTAQGGVSIKGGIRNAKGGTITVSISNSPVNITVQQMGDKAVCTDCNNPEMWGVFEKYLLTLPKNQEGPTKEAAKNLTIQSSDTSSKGGRSSK